jgi:hypothetical protein
VTFGASAVERRLLSACTIIDPGALARVLERFQNLNIVPRRIIAKFGINETLHIPVDFFGLPE